MKVAILVVTAVLIISLEAVVDAQGKFFFKPRPTPAPKPGSCYRPGRGRRSLEDGNEDVLKSIVKRQAQGGNGVIGGNNGGGFGGSNKPIAPPPRPQCYRDYDCQGNKKCCSGFCQTPSYVG